MKAFFVLICLAVALFVAADTSAEEKIIRRSIPSVVSATHTQQNTLSKPIQMVYELRLGRELNGIQVGVSNDDVEQFMKGARETWAPGGPVNQFLNAVTDEAVPVTVPKEEAVSEKTAPKETTPKEIDPEEETAHKEEAAKPAPRTEVHHNKGVTQVAGRDIHYHSPLFLQTNGEKRRVRVTRTRRTVTSRPATPRRFRAIGLR